MFRHGKDNAGKCVTAVGQALVIALQQTFIRDDCNNFTVTDYGKAK